MYTILQPIQVYISLTPMEVLQSSSTNSSAAQWPADLHTWSSQPDTRQQTAHVNGVNPGLVNYHCRSRRVLFQNLLNRFSLPLYQVFH